MLPRPKHFANTLARLSVTGVLTIGFLTANQPIEAHAAPSSDFIKKIAPMAQHGERSQGVPASVSIAQAILESGWGESGLTKKANSYFGIKCFSRVSPYQDGCHEVPTTEYNPSGTSYRITARFRKYSSLERSVLDHGHFLRNNSRYSNAFKYTNNPDRFAFEIHKAGYATDPGYTSLLISLMQRYNLYRYDVTPKSKTTPKPDVFSVSSRTVSSGSTEKWIVSFHGSPSPRVTWQESRDGGASWTKISSGITTYGFRTIYQRKIGSDHGVQLRVMVQNSAGTVISKPGRLTVVGGSTVTTPTPAKPVTTQSAPSKPAPAKPVPTPAKPALNKPILTKPAPKPRTARPATSRLALTSHDSSRYYAAGSTALSGRGQPGAKVTVRAGTVLRTAWVKPNGTWRTSRIWMPARPNTVTITMTGAGSAQTLRPTLFFGPRPKRIMQPKLLRPGATLRAGSSVRLEGRGTPGTKMTIGTGQRSKTFHVRPNGRWTAPAFAFRKGGHTIKITSEGPGHRPVTVVWWVKFN